MQAIGIVVVIVLARENASKRRPADTGLTISIDNVRAVSLPSTEHGNAQEPHITVEPVNLRFDRILSHGRT
jgi:hypothetical protein